MMVKPNKQQRDEEFLKNNPYKKDEDSYVEAVFEPKKKFLIICEGENTEPEYFRCFPVPTQHIIIEGGKNSKTALVDYVISIKDDEDNLDREIWCVFDYDIHYDEIATQQNDFNSAIEKAFANNLRVAWSNDSFELWFLLHFDNLTAHLTRKEYNKRLKEIWALESFHNEAKTKEFCKTLYDVHGGTQSSAQILAIKRAKALHESYNGQKNYASQSPCTTVYKLVIELNKNLKG